MQERAEGTSSPLPPLGLAVTGDGEYSTECNCLPVSILPFFFFLEIESLSFRWAHGYPGKTVFPQYFPPLVASFDHVTKSLPEGHKQKCYELRPQRE